MLLFVAVCLLTSFWISFLGTFVMRWLAPRVGLIDKPAARKVHIVPTPLGGGVAVWAAVVIPLISAYLAIRYQWDWPLEWLPEEVQRQSLAVLARTPQLLVILLASSVLALVGLIDDFHPLPWQPRLALQFLCAGCVVASGVRASFFIDNVWFGGLMTVAWFVVLVNSFNFLDNMDGLSAGIAMIVSGVFALMMLGVPGSPRWLVAAFFLILAGALLGFLCHNWSPARIFMGDSGSYFIGFSIAATTILGTFYTPAAADQHVMLAPFCVLAIPLYDICSVTYLRLKEGRSPFSPDKRHFSHRLVAMGFRPVTAVLVVHLATLTTGLGGLALYTVPNWNAAGIPVAIVLCVVLMIAILEQTPGSGAAR